MRRSVCFLGTHSVSILRCLELFGPSGLWVLWRSMPELQLHSQKDFHASFLLVLFLTFLHLKAHISWGILLCLMFSFPLPLLRFHCLLFLLFFRIILHFRSQCLPGRGLGFLHSFVLWSSASMISSQCLCPLIPSNANKHWSLPVLDWLYCWTFCVERVPAKSNI